MPPRRIDAVLHAALTRAGRDPRRVMDDLAAGGGTAADSGADGTGSRVRTAMPIWPGGERVRDFPWGVEGDFRLDGTGLAVNSLPLAPAMRWSGPGDELVSTSEGLRTRSRRSCLHIDATAWPETVLAACQGRPVGQVVEHAWLCDHAILIEEAVATPTGMRILCATVMVDVD